MQDRTSEQGRSTSDGELRRVKDEQDLQGVLREPIAVLYKHSPLCGLSAIAAGEVRTFVEEKPETPVYMLDVIRDRHLAREVERQLGIRHESPQVIVLRGGAPVWDGSHRGVTAEALRSATSG